MRLRKKKTPENDLIRLRHLLLKEKGKGCSLFSAFSGWFPDLAIVLL